ncbi:MliC family protein [Roseobacter sp.]|uniref:MliC family protein n=1 Tax=Roseobacter sp. TaxID=1907202 RepID=UPI003859D539
MAHWLSFCTIAMLSCTPLAGNAASQTATYLCERSVELPVVFVTDKTGAGIAVLLVEGALVTLEATPTASGVRYAAAPNESGYVWWTKGDAAMLTWFDAATGQETPVYSECEKTEP